MSRWVNVGAVLLLVMVGAVSRAGPGNNTVQIRVGPKGNVDPNHVMAEMRFAQGRYRMAIDESRRCLEKKPGNSRCKLVMARAFGALGACEQAFATFAEIRFKRVWDFEAAVSEGQCHLKSGDVSSAVGAFEEAVLLAETKASPRFQLALGLMRAEEWTAAREQIDELYFMKNPANMPYLAQATWELETGRGDFEATFAELVRENEVEGGAGVQIHLLNGRRWMDLGEPFIAAIEIMEAIKHSMGNVRAVSYRAEAIRRQGDPIEAFYIVHRPWIAETNTPVLRAITARVLVDLGDWDDVEEILASLPDPEEPEGLASRWYAAFRRGDLAEASVLAASWRAKTPNLDRTLEQLIPVSEGQ